MRAYLGLLEDDRENAPEVAPPGYERLVVDVDHYGTGYVLRGEPTSVNGAPAQAFAATWPGVQDVRGKCPALYTEPHGGELLYVWAPAQERRDAAS